MRTEIKHENTKTTLMVLLITQNTHEKYQNTPKKSFFFVFSKAKNIILLYIEIKKILNSLVLQPIFFFTWAKTYFNCYEYYEKSRKFLVNNSKFC